MSRYGDNCEKHDLPFGDCIECERDEIVRLNKRLENGKAYLLRHKNTEITSKEALKSFGFAQIKTTDNTTGEQ